MGQLSKNNFRKIVIIFLSISLNMGFGCSKEPSHRDGSFEYPQHMFWLRNKENNLQLGTLIWRPGGSQVFRRITVQMYKEGILSFSKKQKNLSGLFWRK